MHFCPESLFTMIAIPKRGDFSDFGESLPLRLRPALHALPVSRNHPSVLKDPAHRISALPQKGMDGDLPHRVLQFMVNMNCQRGAKLKTGSMLRLLRSLAHTNEMGVKPKQISRCT